MNTFPDVTLKGSPFKLLNNSSDPFNILFKSFLQGVDQGYNSQKSTFKHSSNCALNGGLLPDSPYLITTKSEYKLIINFNTILMAAMRSKDIKWRLNQDNPFNVKVTRVEDVVTVDIKYKDDPTREKEKKVNACAESNRYPDYSYTYSVSLGRDIESISAEFDDKNIGFLVITAKRDPKYKEEIVVS